jgi:hypothetical protein
VGCFHVVMLRHFYEKGAMLRQIYFKNCIYLPQKPENATSTPKTLQTRFSIDPQKVNDHATPTIMLGENS